MDEAEKLIKELEEKRCGHIEWKTVVLFCADSDLNKKESVFLYKIGDTFWYEDFEKEHTFLGFKINPPKNYKYVKFEGCFKAYDVEVMEKVLKSDVCDFCDGKKKKLKNAGVLGSLFKQTVLKIDLRDGKQLFMEMLNVNDFIQLVELEKNKYKWVQTREVK